MKKIGPKPFIDYQCEDCGRDFKSVNKTRKLCGNCTNSGEARKRSTLALGPIHFASGAKQPGERVWEQMMRECR